MSVLDRLVAWIKDDLPGSGDATAGRHRYWRHLNPRKDTIRFVKPNRCSGVWTEPGEGSVGCGHIVRLHFMAPKKHTRGLPITYSAQCPICGTPYPFSAVKLVLEEDYEPTPEEERDIRAMYADVKRLNEGKGSSYDPPFEERVATHCLTFRAQGSCETHMTRPGHAIQSP